MEQYTEANKVALIILHTVKHTKPEVGRARLVDILTGSRARPIFKFGWNKSKYYGRLQKYTRNQCRDAIDQLLKWRYLTLVGSDYPILKLTPRGEEALKQRTPIELKLGSPESEKCKKPELSRTLQKTLRCFQEGLDINEIAQKRGLTSLTVYQHLALLIRLGLVQLTAVVPVRKVKRIQKVIHKIGLTKLHLLKDALPETISYEEIRCVVEDEKRRRDMA